MELILLHALEALGIVIALYIVLYLGVRYRNDIGASFKVKYCPDCEKKKRGKVALRYDRGWNRFECPVCNYHENAN